jgi:hypothetical protein
MESSCVLSHLPIPTHGAQRRAPLSQRERGPYGLNGFKFQRVAEAGEQAEQFAARRGEALVALPQHVMLALHQIATHIQPPRNGDVVGLVQSARDEAAQRAHDEHRRAGAQPIAQQPALDPARPLKRAGPQAGFIRRSLSPGNSFPGGAAKTITHSFFSSFFSSLCQRRVTL